MPRNPELSLAHYFRDFPDPRRSSQCEHDLLDILVIAICAVVCGQDTWTDIAHYGEDHYDWLKTFLRLPNGIPSHDTFRYVFTRLDPDDFQHRFLPWVAALSRDSEADDAPLRHIALDGKTARGSRGPGRTALHLVSAWAAHNHLTLGQVATDGKSNEITAIPRLLQILELTGAIVTIDAVGCQTQIAAQIRERGADYVLAVKGNQPRLFEDVQDAVAAYLDHSVAGDDGQILETIDDGHGRREVRTYTLVTDLGPIRDRERWPDLYAVCMAVNERTLGEKTTTDVRYYIGSMRGTVADYAQVIRGHWGIENQCHWVLDVAFREDACRAGREHGAENLAWMRRMALSILRNDTTCQRSLRSKSTKALGNHEFLLQLLAQVNGEKDGT